jgi:hypothetical protein
LRLGGITLAGPRHTNGTRKSDGNDATPELLFKANQQYRQLDLAADPLRLVVVPALLAH